MYLKKLSNKCIKTLRFYYNLWPSKKCLYTLCKHVGLVIWPRYDLHVYVTST